MIFFCLKPIKYFCFVRHFDIHWLFFFVMHFFVILAKFELFLPLFVIIFSYLGISLFRMTHARAYDKYNTYILTHILIFNYLSK